MATEELSETDRRYLDAASRLAMRHAGLTAENPSVGCLIVSKGRVVGRGVTGRGGRPHAERVALDEAGSSAWGATVYVTLEPCAHHGRTPPCADALVAAGVARIVIGTTDPDPRVDGRGLDILRSGNVDVAVSRHATQPNAIEGFLSRMGRGLPFVTLKLAVSCDGFIGRAGEGQIAISGAVANRQTHLLRMRSDLVAVGVGTALADDPLLTVRLDGLSTRSPARLVVDPGLRTSLASRLAATACDVPLLIATNDPDGASASAMREKCVEPLRLAADETSLRELLRSLSGRGIGSILCEGGGRLALSLLADELVDRLILIRSPKRIGGSGIVLPNLHPYLGSFHATRRLCFGDDLWLEYDRKVR